MEADSKLAPAFPEELTCTACPVIKNAQSNELDTHGGDPARPSTLAATASEELAAPPSALLAAPASGEAGVGDEVADTSMS